MKGIITKLAHDGSKWVVAKGEDGIEYFIGCNSLINPKQYKHYAYKGNLIVFDKDTSQEWRLPHGCNATLAEIADPNKEQKRRNYVESEMRRIENEERKRQAREKQEELRKRAEQRRAYEADNTWYDIQRHDGTWKPVLHGSVPLKCRGLDKAREKLKELRSADAGTKYRCVKSIGLTMVVRSRQNPS